MRRSLAILATFAIVLSFFPLLPFVPAQVAQGATTNLTCTGSNDDVAIQAAITAAAAGDTINIAGGVCDIQFTILVNKPLTLQGQGKDVTYLKGSQVAAVQSAGASVQAKLTAAKASAQAKAQQNTAAAKAATTATDTSAPKATSQGGHGDGTGGGKGRAGQQSQPKTDAASGAKAAAKAARVHTNAHGKAKGKGANGGSARIHSADVNRGGSPSTPTSFPVKDAVTQAISTYAQVHFESHITGQATADAISNTTGPGIAVFANMPGRVTIQGFTITGFNNTGTDAAGGGLFVDQNTPVTIQNNTFRLNAATRGGGFAILKEDSTLNGNAQIIVTNNTITQNVSQNNSSAVFDTQADTGAGGGIWTFTEVDNLQLTNNQLTNNTADTAGGGVAIGFVNKNFVMSGNLCQANSSGDPGGCIRVAGARPDSVNIPGGSNGGQILNNQFIQNAADDVGGAVRIGQGNANWTISGNTFDGNFADESGGGLETGPNGFHYTITNNTFTGNLASYRGGAINMGPFSSTCGSPTTFTGNTFRQNNSDEAAGAARFNSDNSCAQLSGNTWAQNGAGSSGGAIVFARDGISFANDETNVAATSRAVTISGDTFSGNSSASNGNAGGGAIMFGAQMPDLSIANTRFEGNAAGLSGGALDFPLEECFQGGACVDQTVTTVSPRIKITGSVFVNNSAACCAFEGDSGGGAIRVAHDADDLQILTSLFQGNSTTVAGSGGEEATGLQRVGAQAEGGSDGGALLLAGTTSKRVTIQDTQFVGNTASDRGGAIFTDQDLQALSISGTGAPATCAAVSASAFTAPTCSLFQGNKANDSGGGIIFTGTVNTSPEPNATIQNTLFQRNSAQNTGGALVVGVQRTSVTADGLRVTGNVFQGNTSERNGGAIATLLVGSGQRIDHNTFDGNKAASVGGAIRVASFGGNAVTDKMSVDHNTFTNNTATVDNGGAVAFGDVNGTGDTNVTFAYNLLKGNTAGDLGGGLAIQGAMQALDVFNNVLERNTARTVGGNLFVVCTVCDNTTAYMNIDNNTLTFGSAPEAGGVFITSTNDADSNGQADGIAFWNNISTLNLSGDFDVQTVSVPVLAYNSIIGTTANNAVCDALDACLLGANPQFLGSASDNFHIPISSLAVNLGASTTPPGPFTATAVAAPSDDCSEPPASNDCGVPATPGARVGRPDAGAYEAQGQSPTAPTPTAPVTRTATLVGGVTATPSDTPLATVTINFTATLTVTQTPTKTATNTQTPTLTASPFTATPTDTPCIPGPFVTCGTPTVGTPVASATATSTGEPTATVTRTATAVVVTPTGGHR